ncbi:MAG: hypothetical protein JSS45_03070 [Proteobacteria bacterium]|nr:hypothetical protein [Pseudomonadota bacterium]
MSWRKLGRIFDPAQYALPGGCSGFAQSPQALVCDGFVRVYFSSREREPDGMYVSHVVWADFDSSFSRVLQVAPEVALARGELGCFDEHGVFPFNPLRHEGRILAYTTGWSRRVSVSVETGIGLVESSDGGKTFTRVGNGPVLSASLHEPCLVGDGFVLVHEGVFHMWYIFGTGWKHYAPDAAPDRTYKIGHATSTNGVSWQKEEARRIVADRLGPDESQALPSVLRIGTRWHMVFCYRQSFDFRKNSARGYRLGHAWSDDLSTWVRDDHDLGIDVSAEGWDSEMMCYPHLFEYAGRPHLLYNGNAFGRDGFGLAVLE